MPPGRVRSLLAVAVAAAAASGTWMLGTVPSAFADRCPDVQVVFARGTDDPPGVGPTGQAFIDSLRPRLGTETLDVYPVDYPASFDWTHSGEDGIRDASTHVVSMAHDCPNTAMVLGGYSAGAAVMGFLTAAAVPDGIDPAAVPKPMDPEVAQHVSSVVLYALPSDTTLRFLGEPPVVLGPLYAAKTIEVCASGDPICSDEGSFDVHKSYSTNAPVIDEGAVFAAGRLPSSSTCCRLSGGLK